MDNKILTGIIGLLCILAGGFGGSQLLTENELNNAYVCTVTEEVGIFWGGISGTMYRGYPNIENYKGYKDCKNEQSVKGVWIDLTTYARDNGINPLSLIQTQIEQPNNNIESNSGNWKCYANQGGCVKI